MQDQVCFRRKGGCEFTQGVVRVHFGRIGKTQSFVRALRGAVSLPQSAMYAYKGPNMLLLSYVFRT